MRPAALYGEWCLGWPFGGLNITFAFEACSARRGEVCLPTEGIGARLIDGACWVLNMSSWKMCSGWLFAAKRVGLAISAKPNRWFGYRFGPVPDFPKPVANRTKPQTDSNLLYFYLSFLTISYEFLD